jgi:hypothetical protein
LPIVMLLVTRSGHSAHTGDVSSTRFRHESRSLLLLLVGCLLGAACGPSPQYSRTPPNVDGSAEPRGSGGAIAIAGGAGRQGGGSGVAGPPATGGIGGKTGTVAGGAPGGASGETSATDSGGRIDSGAMGGAGTETAATGGAGSGNSSGNGAATGGVPGTGGHAVGGNGAIGGGGSSGNGGGGATGAGGSSGGSAGGSAGGGAPATRILSIDFVGGVPGAPGPRGGVAMDPTEIAGVVPAKNWNTAPGGTGSLATLAYSDGTVASGAKAMWAAPHNNAATSSTWSVGYTDVPGDVRMMNGYLDPSWDNTPPSTAADILTVSGLPAGGPYDVYVYVKGEFSTGGSRTYEYAIGATKATLTQVSAPLTQPSSPFVYRLAPEGGAGNYVVFQQVSGATLVLSVKPTSASDSYYRSPVNGIQIVWRNGP